MGWLRRVAVASLVGATGCANVWGFADLTSDDQDSAADGPSDGATEDSGDSDGSRDMDGGISSGGDGSDCSLANSTICRGMCPGDASPCGCLADPTSGTSYCGSTGSGMEGAPCFGDTDCAPGYGCPSTSMKCSRWCRPTTVCPTGTSCHDAALVFNGETYGFCY